jgi:hypothetical protein
LRQNRIPTKDVGRPSLDPSLRIVPRALRENQRSGVLIRFILPIASPLLLLTEPLKNSEGSRLRHAIRPRGAPNRRVVSLANPNELRTVLFEP